MKKIFLIIGIILCINAATYAAFPDAGIYYKEIEYLTSKGIISGYEDGTFRPEGKITRAELVKMIVTAKKLKGGMGSYFSDVTNSYWAKEYIDIAVANGIIKGDVEGTFRPGDNITYGEVATVLVRAMGEEESAEKLYLSWPQNYMQEAKYLNLFNEFKTNDLIDSNEARRDNVALMIYNMLTNKKETTVKPGTPTAIKIDTKTAYAGIVEDKYKRNGEVTIKVIDDDDTEVTLTVNEKYGIPKEDSFIIYQLTSDEEVRLRSELTAGDIDNGFITVQRVEGEIIKLKGYSQSLDLDLNEYKIGSKTYKLNKMNFFIIELDDDENEFLGYEIQQKDDLKLEKDDKLKFDDTLNVCYVIKIVE